MMSDHVALSLAGPQDSGCSRSVVLFHVVIYVFSPFSLNLITLYPLPHFGIFVPLGRFGVGRVKGEGRQADNGMR